MKNLVIIAPFPLDRYYYERFGIEKLRKKFNVKVLDLTPWYKPDYISQTLINVINDDKYYLIKSKDDFLKIQFSDEKLFLLDLSMIDRLLLPPGYVLGRALTRMQPFLS